MRVKYFLITTVSALITGLLYTFYDVGFLAWFSLLPYFYVLMKKINGDGTKPRKMYFFGFWFSFVYYSAVFYWFTYQYPLDFMGFSKALSVAYVATAWFGMSLLYSITLALVPCLTAYFAKTALCKKYPFTIPFFIGVCWSMIEWMHTKTFMGVPWTRLALTQQKYLPILQISSVFGSYFVSFLIVSVNACVAYALYAFAKNEHKRNTATRAAAVTAAGLFVANYAFGAVAMYVDEKNEDGERVKASATQANMLSQEKWSNDGNNVAYQRYSALVREAAEEGAKLIVLPETAFTYDLNEYVGLKNKISALAEETECVLLVGAFDSEGEKSYNAMYVFYPDGSVGENTYKKRRLVPFGEYLPAKEIFCTVFPFLNSINLFEDELTAGKESENAETEYGSVGFLICFDSIYENLALDSVKDGAELIAVSTNDSWFLDSSAIYEHNGQSILRAIETRRYVVRAANTGMSSIISPTGKIKKSIEPLVSGEITDDVVFRNDITFYTAFPNLFIVICHIAVYSCLFVPQITKIFRKFLKKNKKRLEKSENL